jgi:hypothetical protein
MALTLPLLGLGSALTPHHTSRRSSTLAPSSSASNSITLPASCRARSSRASGHYHVSSFRLVLHGDDITSNFGAVTVCNVKSEEYRSGPGRSSEQPSVSSLVPGRVCGASALAVAASLMSAGASLADEVAASPVDGSDVGISTTVSVLFVVATVGLAVLTGGVIDLGLSEFLEKRALQEEQKKVETAKSSKKEKATKQAVKVAARVGGPKGFGSGKRSGTKDDDEEASN